MTNTQLLTVDEVASRLQVHPHTVRIWLREKKLPAIRLARTWRIKPEDLERFLEERRNT